MPTFPRNLLTPRFSLRALLVVVTVGGVVIGWRANRLWQNQRALAALTNSGLHVQQTTFPPTVQLSDSPSGPPGGLLPPCCR